MPHCEYRYGPERVQGLTDIRRLETTREQQQSLCAMNWMRIALPGLVEKEAPLRALLGEDSQNCFKSYYFDWTQARAEAWQFIKDLVKHNALLGHRKLGRTVLGFPDVSNISWGSSVIQVSSGELEHEVPVKNMHR